MNGSRNTAWRTLFRLVTFRATRAEIEAFGWCHLILGLAFTWLVGIGRTWDKTGIEFVEHLGLGSIAYVFLLSGFLWITIKPFASTDSSYRRMLTFVCMTSPPGLIYAIPVEKFLSANSAQMANVGFLTIVSVWRVALYVWYLVHVENFRGQRLTVLSLLPLSIIVSALGVFGIFAKIMLEMGDVNHIHHDSPFVTTVMSILIILALIAMIAFLPLIIAYQVMLLKKNYTETEYTKWGGGIKP